MKKYEIVSGLITFLSDNEACVDTFHEIHRNASIETVNRIDDSLNSFPETLDAYVYREMTEQNNVNKYILYFLDETLFHCMRKFDCFDSKMITKGELLEKELNR